MTQTFIDWNLAAVIWPLLAFGLGLITAIAFWPQLSARIAAVWARMRRGRGDRKA
jgi:hypothetical protein